MDRFGFDEIVAIAQRERDERARLPREPTLFQEMVRLEGRPLRPSRLRILDPMPRLKELGKPILRSLGLEEPVRAWWKSRGRRG